eukprot:scaffold398_cov356-Pavlova_lutheri.AAC.17
MMMLATQDSLKESWNEGVTYEEVDKLFDSVEPAFRIVTKVGHKHRYGELIRDTILRHKIRASKVNLNLYPLSYLSPILLRFPKYNVLRYAMLRTYEKTEATSRRGLGGVEAGGAHQVGASGK